MLRDNLGFFLIAFDLSTDDSSFSESLKEFLYLWILFVLAKMFCLQYLMLTSHESSGLIPVCVYVHTPNTCE